MITEVLQYIIALSIFILIQSVFINGVNACFKGTKTVDEVTGKIFYSGMIFYMISPKFFEKHKHKSWSKPCFSCVQCMASVWSAITYWPMVIYLFGFRGIEVFIYCGEVFILVYLNKYFYNKV